MHATPTSLWILVAFSALLGTSGYTLAQEAPYLLFKNSLGEKIEMWLYAQDPAGWTKPAHILDVEEIRNVKFPRPSQYFVVLVDDKFRQDKLGWFDFYSQAKKEPGKEVQLTALYATYTVMQAEQRTRKVSVTKMRTEQRTKTVNQLNTITGLIEPKEVVYSVSVPFTEEIEQAYTVQVPVSQQKQVRKLQLDNGAYKIQLRPSDRPEPKLPWEEKGVTNSNAASTQRPRLGVTYRICPSGMHILSVEPGSPATKCINVKTNAVMALQPGDHIVRIDGKPLDSEDDMLRIVASAGPEMTIEVLDVNSDQTYTLRIEL